MLRRILPGLVAISAALSLTAVPAGGAQAADDGPFAPSYVNITPDRFVEDARPATISRWQTVSWDFTTAPLFDVRVSRTPARASRRAPWTQPAELQGIPGAAIRLDLDLGTVLCVQVRGRAADGRTTDWALTPSCVSRAFGPGALRSHGRVAVIRNEGFWRGRAKVLRPGERLTLAGIPRGTRGRAFVTRHRGIDDMLVWRMPGQHDNSISGFGRDYPTRHTVAVNDTSRPSQHRGKLVITSGGNSQSLPLEGFALLPAWMFS